MIEKPLCEDLVELDGKSLGVIAAPR
jgi:hypothetical protein